MSLSQLLASLTRILDGREAGEDRFVIVEVGQDNRYVQFYFDADRIYGEAVGSYYLEADGCEALTEQQRNMLEWLGWEGPAEIDPDGDATSHANYFREWTYDTPTETIVMDLVRTLVSVYMAGDGEGARIELHRSWYEPGEWEDQIPA